MRDFCIYVTDAAQDDVSMEATTAENLSNSLCFDCIRFEDVTTHRTRLGDYEARVQLGLASGGHLGEPMTDRPALLITFPWRPGQLVVVDGEYGEEADAAVILGIASTVMGP